MELSGPPVPAVSVPGLAGGIPYEDELGRRVDFHALRYTFATMLNRSGVTPRAAMELMRHSDMS